MPSVFERAFELARSGECGSPTEVKKRLKDEGLDWRQLEGSPTLGRQLRALCAEATRDARPIDRSTPAERSPQS